MAVRHAVYPKHVVHVSAPHVTPGFYHQRDNSCLVAVAYCAVPQDVHILMGVWIGVVCPRHFSPVFPDPNKQQNLATTLALALALALDTFTLRPPRAPLLQGETDLQQ